MNKGYREILDRIDIFDANHGHSVDVVLRNKNYRETYSTMFSRNKKARIVRDIACSLELCEELAKYNLLNLSDLAEAVKASINKYNKGKVDVTKRADDIKQYCLKVAEYMNQDLLCDAYYLFDLYKYETEEIILTYNFMCSKMEINDHKFEELLPDCQLVKDNGKEQ